MATFTKREQLIFIPLIFGVFLALAGHFWAGHEALRVTEAIGTATDYADLLEERVFRNHIPLAHTIMTGGALIAVVAFVLALLGIGKNKQTAFMLKSFVAIPATVWVVVTLNSLLLEGELAAFPLFMFSLLLLLPNRILLKERPAGMIYILGLHLTMFLWVKYVSMDMAIASRPPDLVLLLLAFMFTASTAAGVSYCAALLQQELSPLGNKLARFYIALATTVVLISYILYATAAIPRGLRNRRDQARIRNRIDAFEKSMPFTGE